MNLQVKNFITAYVEAAKANEEKTGIPYLVVLAQAALETGWGRYVEGNNYFGIKAGKSYKGKKQNFKTWEHIEGKNKVIYDNFRAYESFEDALKDYSELILRKYKPALDAKSPEEYIEALQTKCGNPYATDPQYVEKIKTIIKMIAGYLNTSVQSGAAIKSAGEQPAPAATEKANSK